MSDRIKPYRKHMYVHKHHLFKVTPELAGISSYILTIPTKVLTCPKLEQLA